MHLRLHLKDLHLVAKHGDHFKSVGSLVERDDFPTLSSTFAKR